MQVRSNSPDVVTMSPDVRQVIAIVVAGALITVLDATVVSIAINGMATDVDTDVATIQWTMTGYLLAMVAVIPTSGWVVERIGARAAWLLALGGFVTGSLLCALAWSAPSLIVFRILQGIGGGLVAPVGMTMVAQAAGPQRMGRAMAMVGIPMMLGPVLGPVLGGALISGLSWRWIFWINLPIGLVTLAVSFVALAPGRSRPASRLDVIGLLMLSPAMAVLVYGLAQLARGSDRSGAFVGLAAGAVLVAGFAWHATRVQHPLIDLSPLRNRVFAAATVIQALMGAALIGSMFLLPLYFQLARGASAWDTGLMLVPHGVGAALALWLTGRLVDRGHGDVVIIAGVALSTLGLITFTQAAASPPTVLLLTALLVWGLGTGCLMAPVSAAAYSVLDEDEIPRATSLLNVTQRLGGALGIALFAVALHLGQGSTEPGTGAPSAHTLPGVFAGTFWWPVALSAAMFLPALVLRRRPSLDRQRADDLPDHPMPASTTD